jgi:non-heme chloroperoxidase
MSSLLHREKRALDYRPVSLRTPDGLTIAAQEWGKPDGPEILFIHGYAQCHLSWARQLGSELAQEFRIVTYDLRGHGGSDKPLGPEPYKSGKAWADELEAVMDATGLRRPVLVAWSYGGRVVGDYLAIYGAGRLAGINYVDATTKSRPELFSELMLRSPALMASEDIVANFLSTHRFLAACFETRPSADEFELMLGFNMMVPAPVRAHLAGRPLDMDQTLAALSLPVLVTHGRADGLVNLAMAEYTAATIPGAILSLYEGAGHASFYDAPERFNAELASFVRSAAGVK